MANKTEERLLNVFSQASGESPATPTIGNQSHADSASEYASGSAGPAAFDPSSDGGAGQSYHGTSGSSSSSSSSGGGGGAANGLESLAGSIFGGALGLIPLASTLYGLFNSKSTQQEVFQKYEMPSAISFEAASTGGGLSNADYGQMGLPRLYDSSETAASSSGSDASAAPSTSASPAGGASAAPSTSGNPAGGPTAGGASSGTPQISVNVQAMDAQSFMSYSGEIAKAVRDAMLNLSSINDVVSEL